MLRSLSSHYQQLFAGGMDYLGPDDNVWTTTPAQYLERIFQIVLTLQPMDTVGYQTMITGLIDLETSSSLNPSAGTTESVPAGHPPTDRYHPKAPTRHTVKSRPQTPTWNSAQLKNIGRVDPFSVTRDEQNFLKLLGPPLVTSPRA